MDYPVATDRELFLALIEKLGYRYDDIRPSSSPDELKFWAHRLLVEWAEEYADGYHCDPF